MDKFTKEDIENRVTNAMDVLVLQLAEDLGLEEQGCGILMDCVQTLSVQTAIQHITEELWRRMK